MLSDLAKFLEDQNKVLELQRLKVKACSDSVSKIRKEDEINSIIGSNPGPSGYEPDALTN